MGGVGGGGGGRGPGGGTGVGGSDLCTRRRELAVKSETHAELHRMRTGEKKNFTVHHAST